MKTLVAIIAATAALALSAPAQTATIHEGSLVGGSFSNIYDKPTNLGAGVTEVTGTGSQHAFDFFVFTLPAGAQTLTFDFWAPRASATPTPPVARSRSTRRSLTMAGTARMPGTSSSATGTVTTA